MLNETIPIYARTSTASAYYFSEASYNPKLGDNWADLLDGTADNDIVNVVFWTGSDSTGVLSQNAYSAWTSKKNKGSEAQLSAVFFSP
jgi:hypothetical protein